ncbi:oligosaccharide flippase family protein [Methanofollis tationis]|uniref:oligosaccharide flippase family protein n=1 Tax=Methanofollis tationis TaxID=81417 RepID=UPI0031B583CD
MVRVASTFAGDIFKLVGGTAISQAIVILASPILTRMYGPEAFGLLSLFTSVTAIIAVIVCMRYEMAIMLPESDLEAANLLAGCLLVTCLISGLTLFFALNGDLVAGMMNAPELARYLWLAAPSVFFSGVFLSLNSWNSRTKHFGRLSVATVASKVLATGTQLGAGAAGYATGGSLIAASVFGQIIATVALAGQIWREDRDIFSGVRKKEIYLGFIRYKKFPLIDTWSALLNTLSWQLPVFLLAFYFSPVVVGWYALGMRMLQFPMSLIGKAISQVFFQRSAEFRSDERFPLFVTQVFRMLVVTGMFPILLVTVFGSDLFGVVFGETWTEAGLYAQILSIWAFVWFISSPLSTLYVVFEKQGFGLTFNLLNMISRLVSLVIGGVLGSPTMALALFALSGVFTYGYLCWKMLALARVPWSAVYAIVSKNLLLFMPVGIVLLSLKYWGLDPVVLVLVGSLSCVLYYLYLITTDRQIQGVLIGFGAKKWLPFLFRHG